MEKQWEKFIQKTDERVAMSLKQGILNSLMDLSETISTSGKTGLNPLMKIVVQLVGRQVQITPKLSTILDIFHTIEFHLIELAKNINPDNKSWAALISTTIAENEEFMEIKENIANEINFTIGEVAAYIKTWDMYKDTWELEPKVSIPKLSKLHFSLQALLGLYMEGDPCTSTFDADVAKYKHMGKICHKLESQVASCVAQQLTWPGVDRLHAGGLPAAAERHHGPVRAVAGDFRWSPSLVTHPGPIHPPHAQPGHQEARCHLHLHEGK